MFVIKYFTDREGWREVRQVKRCIKIIFCMLWLKNRDIVFLLFSLLFSDRSPGPTLFDSFGPADLKDQASPQEEI